jgi:Icc-related predicted phosphoesterase
MSKLKLALFSDLHIEFAPWEIPKVDCDIIVLAGDISNQLAGVYWAINESDRLQKPVIYIMGNHDAYHDDFTWYYKAKEACKNTDVHVLEKDIFEINGYRILGTTLWTDYNLYGSADKKAKAIYEAKSFMADHRYIWYQDHIFTPEDAIVEHEKSLQWIKDNLTGTKDIMITHHMPTDYGSHPAFKGDNLTPAFCSNLEYLILERQPLMWGSGHSHWSHQKMIGNTLSVSNARGYPKEKTGFDPELVIEL